MPIVLACLHFPPSKKVRIESTPSALQPKYVDSYGYIPHDGYDRREVAYYTGRHNAAPLNIAPPVLLCVPEFGLVYDALLADPQFMVAAGPRVFQAAHELCEHMARVYSREKDRQQAFVQWYNKYMATPGILIPSKSSASASNTGENDGAVTVEVGGHQYSPLVFEVKNEMGAAGDPMFQTLGYYQHLYLNGERWDREPVLRASGAPALLLELVGPNLCISGVYTLEGNVVTKEPLTPWIPLLPLGGRMEAHVVQLARVLAAVQSAVRLLECRLRMMATGQEAPAAGPPAALTPWDLAAQLLASSTPNRALQLLQAALREATLTGSAQAAAAAMPAAAAAGQGGPASWPRSRERPWTRLPYPLATSQDFTQVAALPGLTSKPVFTAAYSGASGERVLVKFSPRTYPEQVHAAWADAHLAPQLLQARRLPGGWWLVVQELLGQEWRTFEELAHEERVAAFPTVQSVVRAAHSVQLRAAGSGGGDAAGVAAHGDLRPPNVMLCKGAASGAWEVRLVDLDWAGEVGRTVYPPHMSSHINWHPNAGPGQLLQQEHDLHLLEAMRPA